MQAVKMPTLSNIFNKKDTKDLLDPELPFQRVITADYQIDT